MFSLDDPLIEYTKLIYLRLLNFNLVTGLEMAQVFLNRIFSKVIKIANWLYSYKI